MLLRRLGSKSAQDFYDIPEQKTHKYGKGSYLVLANQLHTSGMLHYLQLQGFVTLGIKVQSFKNSSTGKHNMCGKGLEP